MQAKIQEPRLNIVPIGWCSWYYYYTDITQEDMKNNLEFFTQHDNSLSIDFIQLDDGYFTKIGDYRKVNNKFSKGLDWLFKKIKKTQFKSGIWTAPFFAVKSSELIKNHPEYLLKKKDSNKPIKALFNWGAFEYSLDLTKEQVLHHIGDLYSDLLYACQDKNQREESLIDFFKIDFIYSAVPYDGDYEDKSLTRAQILYNAVKKIRDSIGNDSFLLGCGAPLGPCVGLVDAMRIGTDTAPQWSMFDKIGEKLGFAAPSLKRALLPVLYRSFMHKYFWINDPDCLMIRRSDTKLNMDEINLQLTIFGLSGGQLLISDDMTKLSEEEINDAKLLIPPYNSEEYDPIPFDILYSKYPSLYVLETFEDIGKRYLVAIINWKDKKIDKYLSISDIIPNLPDDEKSFYIYDFWEKEFYGEYNRKTALELKDINAHSCKYFSFIPITEELKQEPLIISTDLHITQGVSEITEFYYDEETRVISIIIDLEGKRKGNICLKLPATQKILKSDGDFRIIDKTYNLWEISIEFQDSISLQIELE